MVSFAFEDEAAEVDSWELREILSSSENTHPNLVWSPREKGFRELRTYKPTTINFQGSSLEQE